MRDEGQQKTENTEPFFSRQMQLLLYHIRYEIRSIVNQYPLLYLPISRWRHGINASLDPTEIANPEAVRGNTELVIEAPPRSANTFAVVAFKLAQARPVRVAHHQHAPAQIIAAAKKNVPALVIIRDPEEATLSRIASHRPITMKQALKDYRNFYAKILHYRDSFVVATFDSVVTDFGAVIRKINHKFGTSFEEFKHTKENIEICFQIIEERYRKMFYSKYSVHEQIVARPSEHRELIKETLRSQFYSDTFSGMRADAYKIYKIFLSYAES